MILLKWEDYILELLILCEDCMGTEASVLVRCLGGIKLRRQRLGAASECFSWARAGTVSEQRCRWAGARSAIGGYI